MEIERARADAHLRSETELAARRERHALELAAAQTRGRTRTLRAVVIGGASLALVAVLAAVAVELFVRRPELTQRQRDAEARRVASEEEMAKLGGLLQASQEQARKLAEELARKKDSAPVSSAAPAAPAGHARPVRPLTHPIPHQPTRPCAGDPHDPLNPCLG